jgi:hypothetical protein
VTRLRHGARRAAGSSTSLKKIAAAGRGQREQSGCAACRFGQFEEAVLTAFAAGVDDGLRRACC